MAKRRPKKKKGLNVNFKGVEGQTKLANGDYPVECVEVSQEVSDAGNDYLSWEFKTIEHEKALYYNTSLQPQALWNLRNLLETLGIEVPDGPMDIELKDMPGLEMIAVVENETYEGRKRPKIVDFMPMDPDAVVDGGGDETDGGGEDEVPGEDEVNEMDADELAELVEEHGLDVNLKKAKTIRKKRAAVIEAMEEAGLWSEGGEEEGEEGVTEEEIGEMKAKELATVVEDYGLDIDLKKIKRLPAKRKAVIKAMDEAGYFDDGGEDEKVSADDVSGMDEKELKELIKEHELDVNLKKFKTLRKKANAVIDALEEAGVLEEEGE